jgi:hypothetical protein
MSCQTHLPVMSSLSHSVFGMLQQGRLEAVQGASVSWPQLGQWKRWLWHTAAGLLTPVTTASRETHVLLLLLLPGADATTCCVTSGTYSSGRGTCRHRSRRHAREGQRP